MGTIAPMAISSAIEGIIPLGAGAELLVLLLGMLVIAVCGVLLSIPRQQPPTRRRHVQRPRVATFGVSS